jgi:hypothetical protein
LTEEKTMPKWLVLPLVALAYFAATAIGADQRGAHNHAANRSAREAVHGPDAFAAVSRAWKHRPAAKGRHFPNRRTTGTPPGWKPQRTRSRNLVVTKPGRVIKDLRLNDSADILVEAKNVTIRRVDLRGGVILNQVGGCGTGLLVEDTTIEPEPGDPYGSGDVSLGEGGYTARRVEIWKRGEGFRASDCGPVRIEDSFAYILGDRPGCPLDLHSDGLQGYYAKGLRLRNATIVFGNNCGTSPYYVGYGNDGYPNEPPINTGKYKIHRLLVAGGGYSFRQGVPASVTGLRIVDKSWVYGPIDSACSDIKPWEAKIVRVNSSYKVTKVVRNQRCNTESRD